MENKEKPYFIQFIAIKYAEPSFHDERWITSTQCEPAHSEKEALKNRTIRMNTQKGSSEENHTPLFWNYNFIPVAIGDSCDEPLKEIVLKDADFNFAYTGNTIPFSEPFKTDKT